MKNPIVLMIICVAVPLWTATLDGVVVDHVGATQPHARVALQDSKHHTMARVTTGSDGKFKFDDLQKGRYLLVVEAHCFDRIKQEVEINDGSRSQTEIKLGPEHSTCRGID